MENPRYQNLKVCVNYVGQHMVINILSDNLSVINTIVPKMKHLYKYITKAIGNDIRTSNFEMSAITIVKDISFKCMQTDSLKKAR